MEIYQIIGLALVAATLALVLRQYRPEYAVLVSLISSVILLGAVLAGAGQVVESINNMAKAASIPGEFSQILFKALGICIITQLASDTCKDAGESAIASKVETAGKIAVLVISLPLFTRLIEIAASLISV